MNQVEVDDLQRDLIDILPENTGYILVAIPIGIPSPPTFVHNMELPDLSRIMHAILGVIDQKLEELNGKDDERGSESVTPA